MNNYHDIIVTTGDLKRDYRVLGPVYFQVSNKGLFGSDRFRRCGCHGCSRHGICDRKIC